MSTVKATIADNVKSMYRNLIKLSKLMPAEKRLDATRQIRSEFRKNKSETDPVR